jgi:GNAT superfamily N-acetyltransferase
MLEILAGGAEMLSAFASIPMTVDVKSILRPEPINGGLGGIVLREEPVSAPYVKDYDGYAEGGPTRWPEHFGVAGWGFLMAREGERWVGGAALAHNTGGVDLLEDRRDVSVLWDIRVHPERRGAGIGRKLFERAAQWSRQRGCRRMKIETQNVNVPACRFYARMGCRLGAIDVHGYDSNPAVSHETMLIWHYDLQDQ